MLNKASIVLFQTVKMSVQRCLRLLSTKDTVDFTSTIGNAKNSPVWAWNEWDKLEEIVLGVPDLAVVPDLWSEIKACLSEDNYDYLAKNSHKLWKDTIEDGAYKKLLEEHNNLIKVLEGEGVKVVHPTPIDFSKDLKTPNFRTRGIDCAMPRDFLLVVGDELIESPMTWRSLYFLFFCYKDLIKDYWRRGAKWTAAPKPTGKDSLFKPNFQVDETSYEFTQESHCILTDAEPLFDAASFLRCGRDIFVQLSQVTNKAGIVWVRRHLAKRGIRVHQLNFVKHKVMHIDCCILFPKPGLAISCPDRQCQQIGMFKKAGWDVVISPYYMSSRHHTSHISSQWLALNVLMLDEHRVLVEAQETHIHKFFEKLGIKPIKVPMKHLYTLGGGLHCWTSDIRRNGNLQSYFDWPNELLEQYDKDLELSYNIPLSI